MWRKSLALSPWAWGAPCWFDFTRYAIHFYIDPYISSRKRRLIAGRTDDGPKPAFTNSPNNLGVRLSSIDYSSSVALELRPARVYRTVVDRKRPSTRRCVVEKTCSKGDLRRFLNKFGVFNHPVYWSPRWTGRAYLHTHTHTGAYRITNMNILSGS